MRTRVTLASFLFLFSAACGSVTAEPIDAGVADVSPDRHDAEPDPDADAGPVGRTLRVFHTVTTPDENTALYVTDVHGDAVKPTVLLAQPVKSPNFDLLDIRLDLIAAETGARVAFLMATGGLFQVSLGDAAPAAPVRLDAADKVAAAAHLAPDGSFAIYPQGGTGLGVDAKQYLYVDLHGAQPGQGIPLGQGGGLRGGTLSKDGKKFAFIEAGGVYLVAITAAGPSAPVKVSTGGRDGMKVATVFFSPTGNRLGYTADASVENAFELFVVNLSNAAPGVAQQVTTGFVPGGSVAAVPSFNIGIHSFSPDGKRVAWMADANVDEQLELFMSDVSGTQPVGPKRINEPFIEGGNIGGQTGDLPMKFAPDGKHIFYQADARIDEQYELFSVDIAQSNPAPPVRLSGFLEAGRSVTSFVLAPDGSGIAYTADQRADEKFELFYVDLRNALPSMPRVVNGELGPESDIYVPVNGVEVAFSPDGKKLAYAADQAENDRVEVFVADVATGTPKTAVRVLEATNPGAQVYRVRFAPDGRALVFASDAFDHGIDFWVADVAGGTPGPAHRLNDGPGTVSPNPYFVLTK